MFPSWRSLKVLANEDTLLRTHCCSWCFLGCANWETFVADTKCFWTKSETLFVSRTQNLRAGANGVAFVSATMCPQQCVLVWQRLKATGKSYWQTRTHCCGHIVADKNVSPFARARNICCGHKFCVRDTKNVSNFVQKQFVSAANVSQFARARKHHEQQCVRNNVSSFPSTFTGIIILVFPFDEKVLFWIFGIPCNEWNSIFSN